MRVVIQRVERASVTVEEKVVGKIKSGLMILAGFEEADTQEDLAWMSAKISKLRIFDDENGVMNRSVMAVGGGLLVVSQFTLHANTRKGNRPSYIRAARPEKATALYEAFKKQLAVDSGIAVQSGIFGAMMKVELVNDGPVTITIDTQRKE
ncbi:MAG: D-tyrosyl-tRNA(Tyr) deacylase [Bacteroidetes bacterium]|nr:MAG: D-tyrosyl-tRNA(Tyr) deacylase [Bacteroidota bacterium]PIE87575.1 MAG: D-tyrosyl-tRNA(Tyr) deacylase [Bacteroidota bacterium]